MNPNRISEAEWKIMNVLWQTPGITLKEIAEHLKGSDWGYTTIRTLVNRLVEKGAVRADKSAPTAFKYSAALPQNECRSCEAKSFVSRVFDGSAAMMMTALFMGGGVSEEEAEQLRAVIDRMERGGA